MKVLTGFLMTHRHVNLKDVCGCVIYRKLQRLCTMSDEHARCVL